VSEYQYYEFLALDRPLTRAEQVQLRAISSRATISATRFKNNYEWGDLKADPAKLLAKYFDVHLYLANWGTRQLMLRLPRARVNVAAIKRYFPSGSDSTARLVGSHLVLDFTVKSEESDGDEYALEESIGSLTPLRGEILSGDLRPAYLAWLSAVESDYVDEYAPEPDVPPELAHLSAAQQALAEFLRLDPDLIRAAAATSPEGTSDDSALREWVKRLSPADKERWLVRSIDEPNVPLGIELLRHFRKERVTTKTTGAIVRRTVTDLRTIADEFAASRSQRKAAQLEKARLKAAKEQLHHLAGVRKNLTTAWHTLEGLIAESSYDAAIRLATDLREIADGDGTTADFAELFEAVRTRQSRRRGFYTRWNDLHARHGR